MKFLKILHYVEKSFWDIPSCILLMDDDGEQKTFISIGTTFEEDTTKNLEALKNEYKCGAFIGELYDSPPLDIEDLVNGEYVFANSSLSHFSDNLSSLVKADHMFENAGLYSFEGNLPSLVTGSYMFFGTNFTTFSSKMPNLAEADFMFYRSKLLHFDTDVPSLIKDKYMF